MDVFQAVSGYVTKMVSAGDGGQAASKMKILLLDSETVSIISSATTQSALLSHEIYLTEYVSSGNEHSHPMNHLTNTNQAALTKTPAKRCDTFDVSASSDLHPTPSSS